MFEVAVVSGKGGTGKSSITAALAHLLFLRGISLVAADCDVEAPNLALLLGCGEPLETLTISASHKAKVDPLKCAGCGLCEKHCPYDAVHVSQGKAEVAEIFCEGCGACLQVCPQQAISLAATETGKLYLSKSRYGFPVVHGQLNLGEHNSGKLVTAIKTKARSFKADNGLLLLDGAPGIGCPVIATLSGASLALAITEPTPVASSVLERLIQVVEHFSIPLIVMVNKADLAPSYAQYLEEYFTKRKTRFYKIPYDEAVLASTAQLKPVTEFAQHSKLHQVLSLLAEEIALEADLKP